MGLLGDPAGLPGRHLQPDHAFPQQREAVAQVEGVADQLRPGRRGDAQAEGEGLGGERGHRRGAVTAERLVRGQDVERGAAVGGDPGLGGGGVQDRPLVGQPQLAQRRAAFHRLGLGGGFEDTGSVEVGGPRPRTPPPVPRSWDNPSIDHRHRTGPEPLYAQGIPESCGGFVTRALNRHGAGSSTTEHERLAASSTNEEVGAPRTSTNEPRTSDQQSGGDEHRPAERLTALSAAQRRADCPRVRRWVVDPGEVAGPGQHRDRGVREQGRELLAATGVGPGVELAAKDPHRCREVLRGPRGCGRDRRRRRGTSPSRRRCAAADRTPRAPGRRRPSGRRRAPRSRPVARASGPRLPARLAGRRTRSRPRAARERRPSRCRRGRARRRGSRA